MKGRFSTVWIVAALFFSLSPFALLGTDIDARAPTLFYRQVIWATIYAGFAGLVCVSPGLMAFTFRHGGLVLALTALTTLSALWSGLPQDTLIASTTLWASTMIAIYMAYSVAPRRLLELLAIALGLLAVGSIAVILLLPEYGIMGGVNEGRWNGLATHKNALGRYMMLGLVVCLALLSGQRGSLRVALASMAVLCVVLMIGAQSATATILLLAVALLYALLRTCTRFSGPTRIALLSLLLAGMTAAAVFLSDASNLENALALLGRDTTLTQRTRIWEAGFDAIALHPWLGYGYEAFWQSAAGTSFALHYTIWQVPHAHNGLIEIWLELGVVGIALLLWLLAELGRHMLRPLDPDLLVLYVITLAATIVLNMAEVNLLRYNNIFWIITVYTLLRLRAEPRMA